MRGRGKLKCLLILDQKNVRCIKNGNGNTLLVKFFEWHSRYNFSHFLFTEMKFKLFDCCLHVMQINFNEFHNIFWRNKKTWLRDEKAKRNNTSEDVFTDNLKRICNMMMMEEMNGAETNTEEKKKRIFLFLLDYKSTF